MNELLEEYKKDLNKLNKKKLEKAREMYSGKLLLLDKPNLNGYYKHCCSILIPKKIELNERLHNLSFFTDYTIHITTIYNDYGFIIEKSVFNVPGSRINYEADEIAYIRSSEDIINYLGIQEDLQTTPKLYRYNKALVHKYAVASYPEPYLYPANQMELSTDSEIDNLIIELQNDINLLKQQNYECCK